MSVPALASAPVLSTPDTHIFEDPTPTVDTSSIARLPDEQVALTYEIERTVKEIKVGRWKRIALQFPDQMLVDAPRVYGQLARGLREARKEEGNLQGATVAQDEPAVEEDIAKKLKGASIGEEEEEEERLFILADTSYGACCVDEVAAEHVDADVVVHYGRSCLSPPSRLPVVYVFTERPLQLEPLISTFKETYSDKEQKIILMADIPYGHHIPKLHDCLREDGYTNVYATEVVHNPSSLLPNRTIPSEASDSKDALRDYHLFHISDPPPSLLLTLSSRVASTHIYPTDTPSPNATLASTSLALRRRYALLTSLSTTSVFGILINTLSVKNYMHILSHVQKQITAAGKKHYTFVVGKVNAAKVANFSEVGGWVVIGCWESSLIESKEFWRPIITPFELGIGLQSDEERVWTGEWTGDFQTVLEEKKEPVPGTNGTAHQNGNAAETNGDAEGDYDSEEESAPPEFDLRTGRYVSHSRPMRSSTAPKAASSATLGDGRAAPSSTALTKRANGDLVQIGGVASPGAEFLRENRTWQGLGSDYKRQEEGDGKVNGHAAKMEEGRSGIARGYVVADEGRVH
ncbi:diphthamide biosynthesis protein-like protein [Massarina eburnea CBS 473.64]|uniref:2-(3-amino-3-carboxypropyl)histidine synthase subunit 2 n=1 Tax=Massarina eburnea CBS 473.64 TaxID=1395130 RepID=A0A6A6S6C1_9PLEO|nr:diphthamide biosynthesis protein-like protein [Massarina eburnea CBS 473.64]